MSEQWHDNHKKAIAEKWVQCPPVTTKVKELIGDEVCMGTYGLVELEVMQLETELAEARAEIEKAIATEAERWADRLNWLHTKYGADCSGTDSADLLDCVEEEIKQVINSQSELIEQMRDALLLFAEGAIHDFHYVCQHRDNCLCLACQKVRVKAALVAERGE